MRSRRRAERKSHSWPVPGSSTTTPRPRSRPLPSNGRFPWQPTLRAKGVFPGDHPLSLGVFGYAGTRHATAALLGDPADVLIVLGSGFNERDTMHWTLRGRASKTVILQVNTDMDE